MDEHPSRQSAAAVDEVLTTTGRVLRMVRREGMRGVADRLQARLDSRRSSAMYRAWVKAYDTLTAADRKAIRARVQLLQYRPRISVIMPVYNTEEVWLRRAIESVLGQLYPHWQLCVADDHSSRPHVRPVLEEYARRDPRLTLVFRDRNGHISAASNSALRVATGEFVALLDHDDELAEHALYMMAEELSGHPEADLIYSDEDKIDHRGRRHDPHFKPDWNPDLFYSMNLVTHLALYRRSVVEAAGGFHEGVEGSQDYDLTLRLVERIAPARIRHVPFVLYHWRAIPGSTALASGEKEYAHEAARRAIGSHLERRGIVAEVRPAPGNTRLHRVVYPVPRPPPRVSLILPAARASELLCQSVAALLRRTEYASFELLVACVPGARGESRLSAFADDPRLRVLELPADGPAALMRAALGRSCGDVIGLLGLVEPLDSNWLAEMVSHAMRPEIGAVGAKLYDQRGAMAHAGLVLGLGGVADSPHRGLGSPQARQLPRLCTIQNCSAVSGACLVVRRELIDLVGGPDVTCFPSAYFDIDLCLRLGQSGFRTLWTPCAELRWLDADAGGTSRGHAVGSADEQRAMMSRWGDLIRCDPGYNPNLSLIRGDGSLAIPPRRPRPWGAPEARESVLHPFVASEPWD